MTDSTTRPPRTRLRLIVDITPHRLLDPEQAARLIKRMAQPLWGNVEVAIEAEAAAPDAGLLRKAWNEALDGHPERLRDPWPHVAAALAAYPAPAGPAVDREQQIIDFIYRMREPDIVRPDEEASFRHLLQLYAEAAGPAVDVPNWEALRVAKGWPTPLSMMAAADGLDKLAIPKYGDILRWVAARCDGLPDPTGDAG